MTDTPAQDGVAEVGASATDHIDRGNGQGAGLRSPSGRLPTTAAAWVAEVERITNSRDLTAAAAAYCDSAVMETLTDGASEVFHGVKDIAKAQEVYLAAFERWGLQVRKQLIASGYDVVVNDWQAVGDDRARGVEWWYFDADGKVREHRLYSFLNVKPTTSFIQRLRLLLNSPSKAISFFLIQRRRT